MKIIGVIPSRFASMRFPGKPLVDINGKTMIRRVYEQTSKSPSLTDVIVATDDQRIFDEVKSFGGKVIITSAKHKNGTERCNEVASKTDADVIINVQGDEPFIQPEQIDLLAGLFEDSNTQIGTLIKMHPDNEELRNPARVKAVVNRRMDALYFSRSVVPFPKHQTTFYKHIGIYGYRKHILQQIVALPESELEKAESLEQLRWLENGFRIQCAITTHESLSIDTPDDLKAVLKSN